MVVFSRARRADNGNLLAGLHVCGEVLDDHLIRRVGIAEADVFKPTAPRTAGISALPPPSGSSSLSRNLQRRGLREAAAVCIFVMPCAICVRGE